MIVQPKIRGFICTTAHPAGCARHIEQQINFVKKHAPLKGCKNVLVIGASTGYGLASRIAATWGAQAKTIGVMFEKPAIDKRTASAGWYNTAAFEKAAEKDGFYAKSINGDAFSNEIKQQVIDIIKRDWPERVDLVIYSLASPKRLHPSDGTIYNSELKPIGDAYTNKTIDVMNGTVSMVTLQPASHQDIANTVQVMGGEDWEMWMDALGDAGVLANNVQTVAYSYIGPELTYPVYKNGTIGRAKEHLEQTAKALTLKLKPLHGKAVVSVNKAVVTQASAAIPVVPLYISLLFKIMKDKNIHEGCIEQIWRLFHDYLCAEQPKPLDDAGRIRLDDLEMRDDVQAEISRNWDKLDSSNILELSDLAGYREEFHHLFGFSFPLIDYNADIDVSVPILSIED
ncbi:MAG: trans-2-enoyl-CoA reductase family protein [Legionellales bacterium]|nr:trans-2-enoyl-CoA reductase family protein [Legionellales bacterium]